MRKNISARLLIFFIVVQVVILEIAITFFDAGVNLDSFQFIPLFFALVVAVACSINRTRAVRIVVIAFAVASVARFGVDTTTHPTLGYAMPVWVHSQIMADVRALPENAIIYTNAPDAIYLLDDRATASIPERLDFSTLKPNQRFDAQLTDIRRTLLTRGGYVVYVRGLDRDAFLPTEASVIHDLHLHLVRSARDGAVYTIPKAS
jgi:hypothetical protein